MVEVIQLTFAFTQGPRRLPTRTWRLTMRPDGVLGNTQKSVPATLRLTAAKLSNQNFPLQPIERISYVGHGVVHGLGP